MAANPFDQFDQQAVNPFDQFDVAVAPKPEKTGVLRAAADIPVQVGRGVAVGVKALSDVFGANNPVSRAASGVEDFLGGLLSAQAKNDQTEIARIMKDAEDKGVGDQVTAAVKAFATAPVDMLSQALGTAVPVIAGGLAGSIARLGAAGVRTVGAGVGAAMGAGTVKGQIYDAVKQELRANNVPEAEADQRAQQAQEYGGKNLDQILMGAGIGAAEAAFGAERILTGLLRKGAVEPSALPAKYRIPTAAATEAVPEMAQAAQEQVAQNIALQREGYDVPTMRGVAGQAALEGLAGAGLGAITGAVQRREVEKPAEEKPTPLALEYKPEALVVFPDGSVGKRADVENYINSLPEDQRIEARARLLGMGERPAAPIKEGAPLTEDEIFQLDQQLMAGAPRPRAEDVLEEVRGKIKTAPLTTPADLARIRDDHETAVINSLLEQDKKMQSVSDLARLNLERMSQTESMEAATQDADRRVREARLMGRVQSLIDQNIPFASTAIADINRKFDLIGEAPLDDNERSRVQNIMTMAQGFTDFVKLPSLPVREQDRFAENQAMEALIKERKPRGEVSSKPVRAETTAPSPVIGEAPVSGRVEEGAAIRPEVSPEPGIAEDRKRAEPVAPPAAPQEKPSGAAGMGQRMVNAANRFRDSAVEQFGLTPEQADRAMGRLMKEKVLSLDPVTGQYKLKDGRFWDREVLLRAAGETVTEPTATQAAPVEAKPVAPIEAKPVTPPIQSEQQAKQQHAVQGLGIVEVPVNEVQLSEDVPQFKSDADQAGVVERLEGKFERTGVAPIQVWRRLNGRLEVISGRHRLDLAQRTGEATIPAQIHDEASGFDTTKAATLDAELNIRDGQGKVKDYVVYFEKSGITEDEAKSRGLLGRALGKRAWAIASKGSEELIAAHRGNVIDDAAAEAIASAAPGDSRLQAVGIKAIQDGKNTANAVNMIQAVRAMTQDRVTDTTFDMFGFDDSAIKEAENMAKAATQKQAEIDNRLRAISGAAKRPDIAKKEGVDVRDPNALKTRIEELKKERAAWDNWATNPDLVAEVRQSLQPTTEEGEGKKSLRAGKAQQLSDFEQTLRTALNRFGLKDIGLKLINGMTAEGSYAQKLIQIASDSANPIRTLRHEAIHALRELGFFSPQQWQSLSKMAKDKWIDQYLKQRNIDGKPLKAGEESRYDAYLREYNGDMEKITEEAVADAFADFDATKPPSGLMQALLARMRNLFQAIKSALTKVESPEQIFGKVERGELRAGERGVAGEKKSLRDRATENFRRWFGDSKVVDENGEPLVVYHGTAFDFDTFKRTSSGEFGPAIYFTDNPREAGEYGIGQQRPGVNIIPAYLSMQNPYTYGVDKFWQEFGKDDGDHAAVERARNAGYDGVIAKRDDIYYDQSTRNFVNTGKQLTHYIVFDPNQIKSAIGNNGEYSITNADIRKSLRSEKPTSTPTAAGQKALDTINQLGMGVQPPPDSKIKEAKATIKKMVEDPELTKKTALDAFRKFMDKFEGWALSADAPFQNALRRGFKRDMVGMEEFLGSLLDSSQSQAVGADAVSTQAVLRGRAEYDTEVRKWVAVDDKNNLTKLSSQLEQIAEKYGLTKEEAQRIAHTYFVATNYNGILKRNERIKAEVEKLREEGKDEEADEKADALVFVSPKQAAMVEPGKALISTIPELSNLVETWDGIRKNFVRTLVSTGLWSPEYATSMINNIDYVPFYREEQIEANEGPREMIRGLQVKAKEHKLKGSEDSVNDVFDNMARWMQYAMNRSIRNHKALQMIDIASEMQEGDRMMATKVSEAKRGMNIVKVWRDGKQEIYDMADPIWLDAFQSLSTVSIPAIKYFTSIANMLRRSVVAYPLFSIGQVPQDAVAAIFSSGLKPRFALKIPYLAVKEFIKTLRGTSETHRELKRFGAVGVRDFNANVLRQDAEILAGIKAPRGVKDKVMYALDHIAMSADNAVRQAVYTASIEAGLQKSEAMEKAFDVINFRRRGSSKLLNLMGQTVPFFYAYLSAQRVAYRTLTGTGISPTTRKAALETLAQTSAAVMALSFLYSMANGDDEDYEKTPGTIRDRSLLIPGSGGVRIPLRPDFFLLPKIIAEHTYQLLSDNGYSDGAKFRKGMYEVLANSVLSPNPVPQAIKPLVEIGINYSFFEGRPIVGFFEQNKEAGRQFSENTSEMAKLFGNLGASPEKVDHFIRGYFGSVGGLVLWATNFFIEGEPGVERPSITFEEAIQTMPGVGAFRQKPNENALKVDFYELRDAVAKAKNTYDDIKLRSPEGLEAFIEDETNAARLGMAKGVTKIADHLSKIRRARQQISNMPDSEMSSEEKQERIKELKEVEVELLKSVDVKSLRAQARL